MVGNHWEPEERQCHTKTLKKKYFCYCVYCVVFVFNMAAIRLALTDCCKDVSETEIVHGVEGQQVVKKLLLLIITAKEGIALVQFSEKKCKN